MNSEWQEWIDNKPEYRKPFEDDSPGCVVCGVAVAAGKRYCGTSCQMHDEGEDCTHENTCSAPNCFEPACDGGFCEDHGRCRG